MPELRRCVRLLGQRVAKSHRGGREVDFIIAPGQRAATSGEACGARERSHRVVKLFVYQTPRRMWHCICPELGIFVRESNRSEAARKAQREIERTTYEDYEVIKGAPSGE
jgi:hypothetical protein